jgi:PPOX class probable F420-dependent enzyme
MTKQIPDEYLDLFEKRIFAHLATLMPDGAPHVTPIWIDHDGQHLLVNTPQGTQKDRNMQERPTVAISMQDPDNPYRYLAVRGPVVATAEEGAREHIEKQAQRYTGGAYRGPTGPRHLHKIAPDWIANAGFRRN